MINLKALNVSLTKHGAHKLAPLLKKYPRNEVLARLSGTEPGINVEEAQAKKNLSVSSENAVPQLWDDVRELGDKAIDGLVLLAIIFSHYQLIKAMREGRTATFRGTIKRNLVIAGKSYTNFGGSIEELGFSTAHDSQSVSYDLEPLFNIPGLQIPASQLLALKLRSAGWDGKGDLTTELIAQKFHEALAISSDQFVRWLGTGRLLEPVELEDADFFSGTVGSPSGGPFSFKSGHTPKKTGTVSVAPSVAERMASLRHNEIQTELYKNLVAKYGAANVGTEVPTGDGTSIDVVVKTGASCWFYEIKIADSLRACIRQSIPQLLEYAFWNCDDTRAEKLIIVAEFPSSAVAEKYLEYLRKQFGIPIHYERYIP